MAQILNRIRDPRADDDDDPGFKKGHTLGRSTNPDALKNKLVYITLIGRVLESQFEVPSTIPENVRKRLSAKVFFRISPRGKLEGRPKIVQSSRNRFFDRAALSAVKRFGPGSKLKLPLPKDPELRKTVLRVGIKARMKGK